MDSISLKDYRPPTFDVETCNLNFQVYDEHTLVTSTLVMKRAHEGELILLGVDLDLQYIKMNDVLLTETDYVLDEEKITILNATDNCTISSCVKIFPDTNTSLEGLYRGGSIYLSQCEANGFRKITFYPDTPDVMAVFTVRVEADKKFPTLLSNGNIIDSGDLPDNRHFKVFHDEIKKSSYIFAVVIGDLAHISDKFVTAEGRNVTIEVYAEQKDINKCDLALEAVLMAMKWDEERYGRCYDRDVLRLVSSEYFNAGAMEGAGLMTFATSLMLYDPNVCPDSFRLNVCGVVAHEYFHNWTGNKVTIKQWLELCLKEGLTVFRDQSFSETIQSPAVQRIDDVATLKLHQFPEDNGPLSAPPRPAHVVEVDNLYTSTTYEKGAEINRMIQTYLGVDKFRLGTDEYFRRHELQAITVEDWVAALSAGSGVDLSAFLLWYTQPRNPDLRIEAVHDASARTLTLTLKQSVKPHDEYPDIKPRPIPVAFALFNRESGEQLEVNCDAIFKNNVKDAMYLLTEEEATITINNIDVDPLVSLMRSFSAPVTLHFTQSHQDLVDLIRFETDGFNKWQATQTLLEQLIPSGADVKLYSDAIRAAITELCRVQDTSLASRLLDVPSETYLATFISENYDPQLVHDQRDTFLNNLARNLDGFWRQTYDSLSPDTAASFPQAMGERSLRNMTLSMMMRLDSVDAAIELAYQQFKNATNMSERLGALSVLVNNNVPQATECLDIFYNQFKNEPLALDQWFRIQAASPHITAQGIETLTQHPDFLIDMPARARAVIGGLSSNPVNHWAFGVESVIKFVKYYDEKNPYFGAGVLLSLEKWYTLAEPRKSDVKSQLEALRTVVKSKGILESLMKLLK